jgi:hypothetical protein
MGVNLQDTLDSFGGELRCLTCGVRKPMKNGDAARYMASAWPKCHGYTMRWVTNRELAQERIGVTNDR